MTSDKNSPAPDTLVIMRKRDQGVKSGVTTPGQETKFSRVIGKKKTGSAANMIDGCQGNNSTASPRSQCCDTLTHSTGSVAAPRKRTRGAVQGEAEGDAHVVNNGAVDDQRSMRPICSPKIA